MGIFLAISVIFILSVVSCLLYLWTKPHNGVSIKDKTTCLCPPGYDAYWDTEGLLEILHCAIRPNATVQQQPSNPDPACKYPNFGGYSVKDKTTWAVQCGLHWPNPCVQNNHNNTVFVYGTLKRNERNHRFLKNQTFVRVARLDGYTLVDVGGYPGLVIASKKFVVGEIWSVDDECLRWLDILEGIDGNAKSYKRVNVLIDNENVQTYEYTGNNTSNEIGSVFSAPRTHGSNELLHMPV